MTYQANYRIMYTKVHVPLCTGIQRGPTATNLDPSHQFDWGDTTWNQIFRRLRSAEWI